MSFRQLWVKDPSHSECFSAENWRLYRSTRHCTKNNVEHKRSSNDSVHRMLVTKNQQAEIIRLKITDPIVARMSGQPLTLPLLHPYVTYPIVARISGQPLTLPLLYPIGTSRLRSWTVF